MVVLPLLPVIATFVRDNFLRINFDNSIKNFLPDSTTAYLAVRSCSLFVIKNNGFCFNTSTIKLFPSYFSPSSARKISLPLKVLESVLISDESNNKSSARSLDLINRCLMSLIWSFMIILIYIHYYFFIRKINFFVFNNLVFFMTFAGNDYDRVVGFFDGIFNCFFSI